MKRTTLLMLIVVAMIAFVSCTPKSAMQTKAVVVDIEANSPSTTQRNYKLYYIDYGVVDYAYYPRGFKTGDTIYVHDRYRHHK